MQAPKVLLLRSNGYDDYDCGYDSTVAETTHFGWRIVRSGLYLYRTLWTRRQSNLLSGGEREDEELRSAPWSCSLTAFRIA